MLERVICLVTGYLLGSIKEVTGMEDLTILI